MALDPRAELSEFLRTRRARLTPADVGLAEFGHRRRVPGLRREELAQLAGVSVAYYTRLEQGNGRNVSAEVLDAISRALRLTESEHAHLLHGQLRLDAGMHADDPLLPALIGELSVRSDDLRRLWAAHDVKRKSHGVMHLMNPLVGELQLRYENFSLPGDQEQTLATYHAEPGSSSVEALRLPASWGADASRDRSAAARD